MPYLTPNSAPSDNKCRTISIPDDPQWLAIVNGALLELTRASNFEEFGSLTPQETADFFFDMFNSYLESECAVLPIGMIATFAQSDAGLPDGWLYCMGGEYSRADYAGLFDVIGTTYGDGDGTTTFNLPDLRARFVEGLSAVNPAFMGATGGAQNHTLTVAELPAHHHTQRMRNGNSMLLAGGSTNRVSVTSTSEFNLATAIDTADAGSGNNFSIMPPFMMLAYANAVC